MTDLDELYANDEDRSRLIEHAKEARSAMLIHYDDEERATVTTFGLTWSSHSYLLSVAQAKYYQRVADRMQDEED